MILLNARRLSEKLSLSVRTIWRLRSSGKLPKPVMVGASVRWRAKDIEEWLSLDCPDMNRFETIIGGREDD